MLLVPNSWGSPLRESDGEHTGILVALWLDGHADKGVRLNVPRVPLRFTRLTLMQGDRREDFPLGGR